MLEVKGLTVAYGGVEAVKDVGFTVRGGSVLGLIGPNGAGKSTTVNAVTGVSPTLRGSVRLDGVDYAGRPVHRIAAAGVARTFQQAQLWSGMTVAQNLALAASRLRRREVRERVVEVAEAVGIESLLDESAATLPYGTRRLAEVARAMIMRPKIMILDEPAAGLSHREKDRLADLLRVVIGSGTGVLLIDHDMRFVMNTCESLVVLDAGRVIARGLPAEIRDDPEVLRSYLGSGVS